MFDLRTDITQTLRSEIWRWAAFPPSSNSLLLWNSWTKLRLKTSRSEYYLNAFPWKPLQKKCFIVKNFTFINYCWSCGLNKEMWEQIIACYGFCFLVVRVIGTAALSSGSISSHQEVCFREAFFFCRRWIKHLCKSLYTVCVVCTCSLVQGGTGWAVPELQNDLQQVSGVTDGVLGSSWWTTPALMENRKAQCKGNTDYRVSV